MNSKSYYNQRQPLQAIKDIYRLTHYLVAACLLVVSPAARAGDAPPWMHALVSAPLPVHDEKTDAVLLYSETNVTVLSVDKIKTHVREAYKILRPDGRHHGVVRVYYDSPGQKVTYLRAWCIPAQGKDYEVKDKEAVDIALEGIAGSELVDDTREKSLQIPAPDPGNIVGYEYEVEERPLALQDSWGFQGGDPVRESRYSLQLPEGWKYHVSWVNYPETKADEGGANQWLWAVSNVTEIRQEDEMPPFRGVAGQMIVSFFPASGPTNNGFISWEQMGKWYQNLTSGRRDVSPEIKNQVTTLTASAHTSLDKMRTLARFIQQDIRYVAIELGIGGFQPHPARDVFVHRYGDCKDKATLMSAMLHEVGIESYYVVINSRRGSVTPGTPAQLGNFNHVVVAIKLPDDTSDPSLIATLNHPRLGRLLFFDPTNEITPLGQIGGYLQANWGLLVTPEGGELVELPKQPPAMNSIERTATLTLNATGTLKGNVKEVRVGDRARSERWALRAVTSQTDKIKPIEELLSGSLSTFQLSKASVINWKETDLPFGFEYSFEAENYAKNAGGLLLVRPRVLGSKSSGIMETKEPRKFPIEFDCPVRDTDTFEITLPAGYEVDDLPPAVDVDYGYANYHSKTEVAGNVLRYSRAFEVKDLSVPVSKADELKKFYRIIAGDERNTAVLKPVAK